MNFLPRGSGRTPLFLAWLLWCLGVPGPAFAQPPDDLAALDDPLLREARRLMAVDQPADALVLLQSATGADSVLPALTGMANLQAGRWSEARKWCVRAGKTAPAPLRPWLVSCELESLAREQQWPGARKLAIKVSVQNAPPRLLWWAARAWLDGPADPENDPALKAIPLLERLAALESRHRPEDAAEFLVALARAQSRAGRGQDAAKSWLHAWSHHGHLPGVRGTDAGKEGLFAGDPHAAAPLEILRVRAGRMADENANELALMAIEALLRRKLDAADQCRFQLLHGVTQRKLRRYGAALAPLIEARKWCKDTTDLARAQYLLAFNTALARGWKAAIPLYSELAEKYPSSRFADDALFQIAELHRRKGAPGDALQWLDRLIEKFPAGDMRHEAEWRSAWAWRLKGDSAAAARRLRAIASDNSAPPPQRNRAAWFLRHWKLDSTPFTPLLLDYYTLLALRGGELAHHPVREEGLCRQRDLAPFVREQWRGGEAVWRESAALIAHGFLQEGAQHVLNHINAMKQPSLAGASLAAALLAWAGHEPEAQWLLRRKFEHELQRIPTRDSAGLFCLAWPLAWSRLIFAFEDERKLPRHFLMSLVREESAFDKDIVSWAGARGLSQLMPETTAWVAPWLKMKPPTPDQLLEPALNLKLGSYLLSRLLRQFDGNHALALGAYNAGAKTIEKWTAERTEQDFPDFIEGWGIEEPREYVKRISGTWLVYESLYGEGARIPPVRLTFPVPEKKP
ncbi:MAG: hypothetical protein GMKNLPBB_00424 [Myxococcota bacterium]|nr:hypothetical protein [Myxococcota bacterium]